MVILVYIWQLHTQIYVQSAFPICPLYQSDFEIVPKLFEYKFQNIAYAYAMKRTIFEIYVHRTNEGALSAAMSIVNEHQHMISSFVFNREICELCCSDRISVNVN